ncbi:MAG TPA: response regulator transcription factor [Alphaproteobacteria bacterium]|nr:response regulator transcription factor [Alphaproteobacteria bacterium]
MQDSSAPSAPPADPESLPHVLVVDDDDRIRALVSRYLKANGFLVLTASDAARAQAILDRTLVDLLVMDVMMPGESGLDFTRRVRAKTDIPVLLLTALGESADRVAGLESGADDYLPKPFEPRELVLRLRAILRRRPPVAAQQSAQMRIGRWMYDPAGEDLTDPATGETRRLTGVEATLLRALAGRAGTPVSREDLAALCGVDPGAGEREGRTIDVQVTRLRRKLEDDGRTPRFLHTVRGRGYMLRPSS